MTKRSYLHQPRPDLDDNTYWDALTEGLVGENCTIGGPVIDELRGYSPKDICAACGVTDEHRAKICLGRPKKLSLITKEIDVAPSVVHATHQTAEAYRMRQDQQIRAIFKALGHVKKEEVS